MYDVCRTEGAEVEAEPAERDRQRAGAVEVWNEVEEGGS
jgi:hypothetical protein